MERADTSVAAALRMPAGAPVRHIRSVVHRDGEPFTVIDAYTIDTPGLRAAAADFTEPVPSVHALGRRLGRRITRAEQELDAVAADAVAARHLGVARRTPVIRARRIYYSLGDEPIQYLVVRYHPDRYRFVVDLVPRSGTTAFATLTQPRCTQPRGTQPRGGEPEYRRDHHEDHADT